MNERPGLFFVFRVAALSFILGALAMYFALGKLPNPSFAESPQPLPYPASLQAMAAKNSFSGFYFPSDGVIRQHITDRGVNYIILETVNGVAMPPVINGIALGDSMSFCGDCASGQAGADFRVETMEIARMLKERLETECQFWNEDFVKPKIEGKTEEELERFADSQQANREKQRIHGKAQLEYFEKRIGGRAKNADNQSS